MSLLRPRAVASFAAATLVLAATSAQAAPCGRPDVDFAFPPNDASNVPQNAQLSAHYGSPALYDDEPVRLLGPAGDELGVSVVYDEAQSMLRVSPEKPLENGFHEVVWPALRSVSSGGVGRGSTIGFTVDDSIDATPPRFAGLSGITWDLSRDRDPCLDRLEDRFVFELELGDVDDDAGRELLSVLVFQTVDPADPDPNPSQVALRAMPASGKLEVRRPAKKAGRTCFAAVVQDLVGNVSGGGEVEVCTQTKRPPFFDGCALATGGAPSATSGRWAWAGGALFLWALARRRGAFARVHRARLRA